MRTGFLVAAVLATFVAGCEVSSDEERAIGEQNASEINSQLPIVTDPAINSYVTTLGDTIAHVTSMRDLDWKFYVVNLDQVNAFSLPGGFVYVNRGLIESTDRLDELAGVLAHEIGHVVQRHSVKQMQKSQKLGIVATLACTLTSLCDSGLGQAAVNIGGSVLIARYSREDELQADSEAVENVLKAGIDPEGVPALFDVLIRQRQTEPGIVEGWFATHPLEESRVEASRELIHELGADNRAGLLQDTPGYHAFRDRIAALPQPSPQTLPQSR
ncbi:MAG TPA: M48 family metallopeptidase [Gemmatimonadaceae bacterium]|jgi:predicted Zn-dependent protease